jgi:hypothetical protein
VSPCEIRVDSKRCQDPDSMALHPVGYNLVRKDDKNASSRIHSDSHRLRGASDL